MSGVSGLNVRVWSRLNRPAESREEKMSLPA